MNIETVRYLDIMFDCFGHMRTDGSNNNSNFFANNSMIVIYGGSMPTKSAFDSGWASLYEPVAGSEVLVKYEALYGRNGNDSNTVDIDNIPTSGTYVADGTATWAAILPAYVSSAPSNQSYGTWTWGDTSTNPIAILCDVTEPAGTGIVQLMSTTVSSTAPTFYTSAFTIGV
jgi:hypothetical protein